MLFKDKIIIIAAIITIFLAHTKLLIFDIPLWLVVLILLEYLDKNLKAQKIEG